MPTALFHPLLQIQSFKFLPLQSLHYFHAYLWWQADPSGVQLCCVMDTVQSRGFFHSFVLGFIWLPAEPNGLEQCSVMVTSAVDSLKFGYSYFLFYLWAQQRSRRRPPQARKCYFFLKRGTATVYKPNPSRVLFIFYLACIEYISSPWVLIIIRLSHQSSIWGFPQLCFLPPV